MALGNPNWKKGVSGNPAGRPVGSGDRQFIRTDFWLARYFESISNLAEDVKIQKFEWVLEKFFSKIQQLPASPEDSVKNAAMSELAQLENYGINGNGTPAPQPGSNRADVEAGTPQS